MNRSENITELAQAVSKCQSKIKSVVTDASNPFFKSKYATLSECWDVAREPLTSNGLAVIQLPVDSAGDIDNRVSLETIILHSSGQFISGISSMKPVKNDPQGVGSCLTYLRRYNFCAVVGIAPTSDDDDGNGASGNKPAIKPPEQKPTDMPGIPSKQDTAEQPKPTKQAAKDKPALDTCDNAECQKPIYNQKTIDWSKRKFNGTVFCFDCQQYYKKSGGK